MVRDNARAPPRTSACINDELERLFQNAYVGSMARRREFDADAALDGAIGVFREYGFEGASAEMLVNAMGIGRQSLYDTFGDKWRLYRSAVQHYTAESISNQLRALSSTSSPVKGL